MSTKNLSLSCAAARMAYAFIFTLLMPLTVQSQTKDFITDVMVIGGTESNMSALKNTLTGQGWNVIDYDLNERAGGDYIYLLYKSVSNTDGLNHDYITDFYIKTGSNPPASLTHDGRKYYPVPCDGDNDFKNNKKGDLNCGASGDYIYLYYTKETFPDNRAVTSIDINNEAVGALGANGSTTGGYDLNEGSGGDFIYMHFNTALAAFLVTLTQESGDVQLNNGDILTGTGGANTHITISDGASVTLSGVNVTNIADDESHQWAGISCLGDATIILADGTTNNVKGGYRRPGIYVPVILDYNSTYGSTTYIYKNLTVQGGGTLNATGSEYAAGIGGGYKYGCGDITISNSVGCVTATKGENCDNAIGAGYDSYNRFITIGDVQTGRITQSPFTTYPYTVCLNSNNGSDKMVKMTFMYGVAQDLPNNTFTRSSYWFEGWATSADGKKMYDNRQSVINLVENLGATAELFAKWVPQITLPQAPYIHFYYTNLKGSEPYPGDDTSELFDGNMYGENGVSWLYPHEDPKMVYLEFETKGAIFPTAYQMFRYYETSASSGDPKTWVLKAKLDASDEWTTISHVENSIIFNSNTSCEVSLNNTSNYYKYFRLELYPTELSESGLMPNVVGLKEFRFRGFKCFDLANCTISGVAAEYLYRNGNTITIPSPTVMGDDGTAQIAGSVLIEGFHYNTTITNGSGQEVTSITAPGDYTLTITAIGYNTGIQTFNFSVVKPWDGKGTETDPYQIKTTTDLDKLATFVNSGETCDGVYFRLDADLTYSYEGLADDESNFTPIGYASHNSDSQGKKFGGIFDGKGHTISGIRIHRLDFSGTGIFGSCSGLVKNLTLTDAVITGKSYVGGIVGYGKCGVQNCHVASTVTINAAAGSNRIGGITGYYGTISNSTCSATINAGAGCHYIGGIIGDGNAVNGLNQNIANGVTINAAAGCYDIGGIMGYGLYGDLNDNLAIGVTINAQAGCYNIGGIMGYGKNSTLNHNFAKGVTITTQGDNSNIGAVLGKNDGSTIQNNYYEGCTIDDVTNPTNVGTGSGDIDGARIALPVIVPDHLSLNTGTTNGIVYNGQIYGGATESLTFDIDESDGRFCQYTVTGPASLALTGASALTLVIDADATTTVTISASGVWDADNGADGGADHPYLITTAEDMDYLASCVNNGVTFSGKYFKLGNDITYNPDLLTVDLDGDGTNESNYTPIGRDTDHYFQGNFDGSGHTLSGIRINLNPNPTGTDAEKAFNDYLGIFGCIRYDGVVTDVTVSNTRITGRRFVGGIAGKVTDTRSVIINNCYVMSDVYIGGDTSIGGIAGFLTGNMASILGTVSNCYVMSNVSIESQSGEVGGIVGQNGGIVTNCHVRDNVTIKLSNSYVFDTGVIVGENSGTICYCTCTDVPIIVGSDVTELEWIGGIAGYSSRTVQNCLAVGVTIPSVTTINCIGAIVGEYSSTLDHNYYINCTVAGATANIGSSCRVGNTYTYELCDCTENYGAVPAIALYDSGAKASGNGSTITAANNNQKNVALYERKLYKDGDWNTLCLPFGVTDGDDTDGITFSGTPLEGATVMELDADGIYDGHQTGLDASSGTLYLNFKAVTEIEAGRPYIVKWTKPNDYDSAPFEYDVFNPVFSSVTVTGSASTTVAFNGGKFCGTYDPIHFSAEDQTTFFLGAANTLYYPQPSGGEYPSIGAFRAYFHVSDTGNSAIAFRLNFGDDATGVASPQPSPEGKGTWYDLAGRKLDGEPTAPGIYIKDGRKIIVK